MAVIFTQTDNSVVFEVGCSGQSAGATTAGRELIEGGTPGATDVTIDPDNNTEAAVFALSTTGGTGFGLWQAGDYVVRLNISGANGTSVWSETHICERTAGGAFNTVASLTGQTTDVSTAGVVSHTVNRATDFIPAGTDSDLYIVVVLSNSDMHGNSTTDITPDQDVDTPIIPVITISVGQASYTASARAITAAKTVAVGQASVSASAQPATATKNRNIAVGLASTTISAREVSPARTRSVGRASVSTTALTTTFSKTVRVALASVGYPYDIEGLPDTDSPLATVQLLQNSANTAITGLHISPNGDFLYVTSLTGFELVRYPLSTPWQLESIDANSDDSLSVSSSSGFFYKPDGSRYYYNDRANDRVVQRDPDSQWGLSPETFAGSFSYHAGLYGSNIRDIYLSSDGLLLFFLSSEETIAVTSSRMETAWDITTASNGVDDRKSFPLSGTHISLTFSDDGKQMVIGDIDGVLHHYHLTVPWDLDTVTDESTTSTFSAKGGIDFGYNGRYLYTGEAGTQDVSQYPVSTTNALTATVEKTGGQTVSVGQAVTTASAIAASITKTVAVGQASYTTSAFPASSVTQVSVGQATVTTAAFSLSSLKEFTAGQAQTTATALASAASKAIDVGQATSTASAFAAGRLKSFTAGQASVGSDARTATSAKNVAVGRASSTVTARSVTAAKSKTAGQASVTTTAQPASAQLGGAQEVSVGFAMAASTALAAIAVKTLSAGLAAVVASALAVEPAKARTATLPTTAYSATAVTASKVRSVSQPVSLVSARSAEHSRAVVATQPSVSNNAFSVSISQGYTINTQQAVETYSAFPAGIARGYSVGQADAVQSALSAQPNRIVSAQSLPSTESLGLRARAIKSEELVPSGPVTVDACKTFSSPQAKSAGRTVAFSEKTGASVGFSEKSAGAVAFTEKTAPEQSFEQTVEWDFTEVLKYCDEIEAVNDAIEQKVGRPITADAFDLTEAVEKRVVVRFGDDADPTDAVGLLGDTAVGAVSRFAEGISIGEVEVTRAKPFSLNSVSIGSTLDRVTARPIVEDNPATADTLEYINTKKLASDSVSPQDGAAFSYGHGGYGNLSYGAPA